MQVGSAQLHESLGFVQTYCTIRVGATETGASDRVVQVIASEVSTEQGGTEKVYSLKVLTGQVGI